MRYPHGETVVLHSRQVVGEDDYGNDVYAEVDTTVVGVAVWPRIAAVAAGIELVQAQQQVVSGLWMMLPAEHDPSAVDEITVYGRRYEIEGEPGRYRSPISGTDAGSQLALRRVTG